MIRGAERGMCDSLNPFLSNSLDELPADEESSIDGNGPLVCRGIELVLESAGHGVRLQSGDRRTGKDYTFEGSACI